MSAKKKRYFVGRNGDKFSMSADLHLLQYWTRGDASTSTVQVMCFDFVQVIGHFCKLLYVVGGKST